MKPSDEQVRGWAQESYEQWRAYSIGEAPRPALQREEYIAHKAYAAGRESMREEAAKICFTAAERYREAGMQLFEDAARECGALVDNLPTSEGDNG